MLSALILMSAGWDISVSSAGSCLPGKSCAVDVMIVRDCIFCASGQNLLVERRLPSMAFRFERLLVVQIPGKR